MGAVVVAGGAARRMGGIDKLALEAGGSTLLDRVLRVVRPLCRPLVVVGPPRATAVDGLTTVQEHPPGGGPLPAVMVGLRAVGDAELVFVLAGDLPMVTTTDLARLLAAIEQDPKLEAAAARDERGAPNPLLAVYRSATLRSATSRGPLHGGPAARLLPRALRVVDLGGHATLNVNRPSDLRRAEALLAMAGRPDPGSAGIAG